MPATFKTNKVKSNISSAPRHDTMEGRDYIVIPAIIMVEGVLPGSEGPILYNNQQMEAYHWAWNYKPIVVYHPMDDKEETFISASSDPSTVTEYKVGVLMNTEFVPGDEFEDGLARLKSECWVEAERAQLVDNRVWEAIEKGQMLELSTGLNFDMLKEPGSWRGTDYHSVAVNWVPDHLAILPDQVGACSRDDGCGFLRVNTAAGGKVPSIVLKGLCVNHKRRELSRKWGVKVNEMSFDQIITMLWDALNEKFGKKGHMWDGYIEEVFADRVIYHLDGEFFAIDYTAQDGKVTLEKKSVPVKRTVEFKPVANKSELETSKGEKMDKKELVASLISNEATQWSKEDEGFLSGLDVEQLEKMSPVEPKKEPTVNNDGDGCDCGPKATTKKPEDGEEPKVKATTTNTDGKTLQMSREEYMEAMPEDMREVLDEGLRNRELARNSHIETIMANERNKFTEEQLKAKPVKELEAIAGLLKPNQTELVSESWTDYGGASGAVSVNVADREPLVAPASVSEMPSED